MRTLDSEILGTLLYYDIWHYPLTAEEIYSSLLAGEKRGSALCEPVSRVLGVVALEKCLVRKMRFEFYVELHVMVDGAIVVDQGRVIADRVRFITRHPNVRVAEVLV